MKKSIAVLGLGKYGRSVAKSLYAIGEDVLVADKDERCIRDISSKVTSAVCANLENEDEVMALGLQNMDIVITAMGGNIAASIMAVSIAKEKGVPLVIAKSSSSRMRRRGYSGGAFLLPRERYLRERPGLQNPRARSSRMSFSRVRISQAGC